MPRTKAEENFIDQYTRKLLVEWAKQTIAFGSINEPTKSDEKTGMLIYFEHAKSKGWVGKSIPHRLTAKGFASAAAFLKR
jgi:hypothetical protein